MVAPGRDRASHEERKERCVSFPIVRWKIVLYDLLNSKKTSGCIYDNDGNMSEFSFGYPCIHV